MTRNDSPTRAERSAARRQGYYQDRVDQAAGSPAATFTAGAAYLLSVLRRLELTNPSKAEQVSTDTTEYLLQQANAHDAPTRRGRRT